MRIPRRTKRKYMELFDDPTTLGSNCQVILFPNGQPELWVKSLDGRRGMTLRFGDGPAGLMVGVQRHLFTAGMTIGGNLSPDYEVYPPKGESRPDFADLSIVQYKPDDWSQLFRAWCEGRADHPGDREEYEREQREIAQHNSDMEIRRGVQ